MSLLDQVFSRWDALAGRHGLEKIKTIGDAYMAAAGVPDPRPDHALAAARMALEMQAELDGCADELASPAGPRSVSTAARWWRA